MLSFSTYQPGERVGVLVDGIASGQYGWVHGTIEEQDSVRKIWRIKLDDPLEIGDRNHQRLEVPTMRLNKVCA